MTIEIRTQDEVFTAVVYGTPDRDTLADWVPDALASAAAYLQRWGAGPNGQPFVRFVDGEAQAGYPATTPVGGEGDVEPSELPGGKVAATVVDAEGVAGAIEAVQAYIAEQGGTHDGDGWEFLLDGDPAGRHEVVLRFRS